MVRSLAPVFYPTPAHARSLSALLVAAGSWSCQSKTTNHDSHTEPAHTMPAAVETSVTAKAPSTTPTPDVPLRLAYAQEPGSEAWSAPGLLEALRAEHVLLAPIEYEAVAALEALAGGHVDAVITTNADVLVNRSLNQPCTVLSPVWVSQAEGLFANPSMTTIEALRGKTVGVELGRPEHAWLEKQLQTAGISPNEVKVQNVVPALALSAIADSTASEERDATNKGRVAAVALTHPESTQIRVGQSVRRLPPQATDPLLYGVLCVAPASVREHTSSWRTVVRVWNARLRHDGEGARQGPRPLASFEDVSRRTLLEATSYLDAFFVEHSVYSRPSLELSDFPE
jgi:NitT/TauT family transport system substrate-binding protein